MRGVRHFTDLQRHFYHPPKRRFAEHPTGQPHCATKLNTRWLIFEKLEPQGQKQEKNSSDEKRYLLHIKFKDNSKICPCINCKWPTVCLKSFPSLKRLQTRLLIPEFVVDNRTEELFRNLMALEQCHYPGDAYICDYIKLLDFLINSEEDVELLVDKRIIVNLLGSNTEVAKMINRLCREIVGTKSYYSEVTKKLNDYYNNDWFKRMASLRNVYFRDIWRSMATVVGFVVLLITILNFRRPFVFTNT